MAHLTITIDGKTAMDGDLGQWSAEPPLITDLKKNIKNAKSGPWSRKILDEIADTGLTGKSKRIDVQTRADGYDFSVTYRNQVIEG